MWVLAAGIDTKLFKLARTKLCMPKHALYRVGNDVIRMFFHHLLRCQALLATNPVGIPDILLVSHLIACKNNLFSIYDNNIITGICMGV